MKTFLEKLEEQMANSKIRCCLGLALAIILLAGCAKTTAVPTPSPTDAAVSFTVSMPAANAVELGTFGKGNPLSAAWSADGSSLAVSGSRGITIYNVSDWSRANFISTNLSSPYQNAAAIAFHPDKETIFYMPERSDRIDQVNLQNNEITPLYNNPTSSSDLSFVLAPDGSTVASYRIQKVYSTDQEPSAGVVLRDALTGKDLHSFQSEISKSEAVYSVAYSPDSKYLAAGGGDNHVRVYKVDSGALVMDGSHDSDVKSVVFSPDGKLVVSAGEDAAVRFWDAGTGSRVYTLMGFTETISLINFCSQGRELFIGFSDGSVQKWSLDEKGLPAQRIKFEDAADGQALKLEPADNTVMKISPDGQLLLTIQNAKTQVWNLKTGLLQVTLPEYSGQTYMMKFSPDGEWFAVLNDAGGVNLWQTETGEFASSLQTDFSRVYAMDFHPTKNQIAVAGEEHQIQVWDLDRNQIIQHFQFPDEKTCYIEAIRFSPDGASLAELNSCGVWIWDTASGKTRHQIFKTEKDKNWNAQDLWFSPDGAEVFVAGFSQVFAWNLPADEMTRKISLPECFSSCHLLTDSEHGRVFLQVFTGGSSKLAVWNVMSGEHLYDTGVQKCSSNLTIDPRGILLAAFQPDAITFQRLDTMQELVTVDYHPSAGEAVFSPDQRFFAVLNNVQGTITVFNVASIFRQAAIPQNATPSAPEPTQTSVPTVTPTPMPEQGYELEAAVVPITQPGAISKARIQSLQDQATLGYGSLGYSYLQSAVWSPDGRYFALLVGQRIFLYPVGAERPAYILPSSGYTFNPVFSPKSKYLATPMDGKTTLWDVQTGRLLNEIPNGTNGYTRVSFSADNSQLSINVWGSQKEVVLDIQSGKVSSTEAAPEKEDGLILSPDRAYAIRYSDATIHIVDPATKVIRYTLEWPVEAYGRLIGYEISSQGKLMSWYHPGEAKDGETVLELWDISLDVAPVKLFTQDAGLITPGDQGYVQNTAHDFSPDGALLATTSHDQQVRLWDTASGELLAKLDGGNSVYFSPDDASLLALDSDGLARVWKIGADHSASLLADLKGFSGSGNSSQAVITGKEITILSNNKVSTWDVTQTGKDLYPSSTVYTAKSNKNFVTVPAGKIWASLQEDGKINLWDAASGDLLRTLADRKTDQQDYSAALALSHDEKTLAGYRGEDAIQLWDVQSGKLKLEISRLFYAQQLIFSPNDRLLAGFNSEYNSDGAQITIWDAASGNLLWYFSDLGGRLAFHPDGVSAAIGRIDGQFSLLDLNTGKPTWQGQAGSKIYDLAFSPDGKILALATDKDVELWDAQSCEKLRTISIKDQESYSYSEQKRSILFSPDGKTIAVGLGNGVYHILK
jgi:WD40 repeat protein